LRQGYRVLIGKYQFAKAHPEKNLAFRRVAPPAVVDILGGGGAFGRRQGPDLFVYTVDERDWFFAEIKGPGDAISAGQLELFQEIERRSVGKEVEIVRAVRGSSTSSGSPPNMPLQRIGARIARPAR
jgi:hypothetical protein